MATSSTSSIEDTPTATRTPTQPTSNDDGRSILFSPATIGGMEIKNRYVFEPIGPGGLCDADGSYSERGVEYYVERARGGAGLIMTGVTKVENTIEACAMPSLPCPTINKLHFITTGHVMTERVHAYGAKIFLQLSGGFGRVSIPGIVGSTAVAPSPVPHRWLKGVTCRALSIEEIREYITKFADSAEIAKRAGFDGVEIHAVHEGYLIDQFALSLFNTRTDEYGGSLENRLRFATDIVKAIKARCGASFPVSLRYSLKSFIKGLGEGGLPGEDFVEVGRDIEEGIAAAKILAAAGYDAFNADVGSYESWHWSHPPSYHAKGLYLPYSEILKKSVDIPIITAGRMDDPDLAAAAVRDRKTDFIGLARPLLADPQLPNKVMTKREKEIRPCLSCQEGCMGRLQVFAQVSCAVNPVCGREGEYGITAAPIRKRVLVVGGGVAGMEAARVCAERGHTVSLYERGDKLGGALIPGSVPDFKADERALIKWYEFQLEQLHVAVTLRTEVTESLIIASQPQVLIIATGSSAIVPSVFADSPIAMKACDALLEPSRIKSDASVLIVGGGLVGCETALWLVQSGHSDVTIVEQEASLLKIGGPLCHANRDMLLDLLPHHHVKVMLSSTVTKALPDNSGFIVKNLTNGEESTLKAHTAIIACGYRPMTELNRKLLSAANTTGALKESHIIGDAKQVKNVMYAIWDAYEVARSI